MIHRLFSRVTRQAPSSSSATESPFPTFLRSTAAESSARGRLTLCVAALLSTFGSTTITSAAISNFGLSFAANQSVWQGGPSGGFNRSGQFGSSAGISYSAVASSGTVAAIVTGQLRAQYPDALPPFTPATIGLSFLGDPGGGSISSGLGAAVDVSGFIPCLAQIPFTNICAHPRNFSLLDAGLFVSPGTSFTPVIDSSRSASDIDNAIGFGPNIDLIVGELGAEVNVDLEQSVTFTPTGLSGAVRYENRATGENGLLPFSASTAAGVQLATPALGGGIWDFDILSVDLENTFRNDIDLDLRPTINYIVGEWPSPGSPLFSVGLIDQSFPLSFNTLTEVGSFSMRVGLAADFNQDGLSDVHDINLLLLEGPVAEGVAVTPGTNDQFDLTGDGLIDNEDVSTWLANAAANNGLASAYLRGDANLDGVVDEFDFNVWNTNRFTSSLLWSEGEFGGDGSIDVSDFNQWNTNKFLSSHSVSTVPEPSNGILQLLALIAIGSRILRK